MSEAKCYHCGDEVLRNGITYDDKSFCCHGCKSVYTLLKENQLDSFYTLEKNAGQKPTTTTEQKYAFLEVPSIRSKFIEYEDEKIVRLTLFLPAIHCSSCIYLLENSPKMNKGILSCQVNFAKREAAISFDKSRISLMQLALFLDKIGYTPNFGKRETEEKGINKIFLYKLGIAGFAFGSIMLWSFPEYLGIRGDNPEFRNFTSYLSFIVSLPVLLYAASDYFISAYKALRSKNLNLDVPITIGIVALYAQSTFAIFNGDGPGYMDSFAGFIFFLLIGKWFQNKTYKMLSFERDYTAYFPVAVTQLAEGTERIVEIEQLKEGNIIRLRNEEILPCDALLLSDSAKVDYSFVTGEAEIIHKLKGEQLFAGGKIIGPRAEFKVLKETKRSQLTQLWNESASKKAEKEGFRYQDKLSIYFLIALLIIASIGAIYWAMTDYSRITEIVVAVLIVACPCALALSAPFTFGNVMRLLGRNGLYLKNTPVIERLNQVTTIVFDKTGTLTYYSNLRVSYLGDPLTTDQKTALFQVVNSSTHPLSRAIATYLENDINDLNLTIQAYEEIQGKGIHAQVRDTTYTIGSAAFTNNYNRDQNETASYVRIGDKTFGRFVFTSELRDGLSEMIAHLKNYQLHVLSGDKDKDLQLLKNIFPANTAFVFNQTPPDKKNYINHLQQNNEKVLMIGDGLNDAGALQKADVGIAVSEDVFRFTPSSDAIIDASKLNELDCLLLLSGISKSILRTCLFFSICYNIVGLSFALTGNLSPLIAAILMPVSSITVVILSTLLVKWRGRKIFLQRKLQKT